MAVSLKHAFVSSVPDAGDPNEVGPNEWNGEHDLTMGANTIMGHVGAGGAAQDLTPAQARSLLNAGIVLIATDFSGVDPTGSTDSTAGLQSAIDAASSAKCPLFVPAGTYLVSEDDPDIALQLKSDVDLFGAGPEVTTIKLDAGGDGHLLNAASGVNNWSVRCMTLDGDRTNQTLAGIHCVRTNGNENVVLRDLWIKNAKHYGIGLQNGTIKNMLISNIRLTGIGGDGIDIKQKPTATGGTANSGVFIENIWVESFGVDSSITSVSAQAGIDVRGIVHLSNITVEGVAADKMGIRFRAGVANDNSNWPNGAGAARSTLTGFAITGSAGTGLYCEEVFTNIANGSIGACAIGVEILQQNNNLLNVQTLNCPIGFQIRSDGSLPTTSVRNKLTGCDARGGSTYGFDIQTVRNSLSGCSASNCGVAFRLPSGADANSIVGGSVQNNTTNLSNSGSNNRVVGIPSITDV